MAITLDPATKVFTVPQADLTFVSGTFYRMNTETYFRTQVNALMDNEDYIWLPDPISHNTEVTVAGVTYARFIEMINGYSVTFTPDSQWTVELTSSNNNLFDVEAGILNQNQVQVIPTNSAGLVGAKEISDSAYTDARVWMDSVNGTAGIAFPLGTPGDTVDNLTDAQSIITARNFPERLHLRNILAMSGTDDITNYDIQGTDSALASITFGGATVTGSHITHCSLSGSSIGEMHLGFCDLDTLTTFQGTAHDSSIDGTITLASGSSAYKFSNCESSVAGSSTPIIDANSISNINLQVRGYRGGLEIRNVTSGDVSIDADIINLTIHSSCTGGTIVVGGRGAITNNGTSTVTRNRFLEVDRLDKLWQDRGFDADNIVTVDETAGTISVAGTVRTWAGNLVKTLTRTT